MKKAVPLVLALIMTFSLVGCRGKDISELPALVEIVELDEAEINRILPGYKIGQLEEAWGEPDDSGVNESVWCANHARLVVNYNSMGKVVVSGLEDMAEDAMPSIDLDNLPRDDGESWSLMNSHAYFEDENGNQIQLPLKPNLEGFQFGKDPDSYAAPRNGECVLTDSLKAATEKYKDRVTYQIHLTLYHDQQKLNSGSDEAQHWLNEEAPDITPIGCSDYFDGTTHFYNIKMDSCSYDALKEFCNVESEYGFILSLYCESIGDFSEQTQVVPQIYNSPNMDN